MSENVESVLRKCSASVQLLVLSSDLKYSAAHASGARTCDLAGAYPVSDSLTPITLEDEPRSAQPRRLARREGRGCTEASGPKGDTDMKLRPLYPFMISQRFH